MFRPAVAGAACLAAGLAAWFGFVAPANAVLATWQPGPIPADFDVIRMRWEIGHMIVAAFKLFGVVSLRGRARPALNDAKLTSRR